MKDVLLSRLPHDLSRRQILRGATALAAFSLLPGKVFAADTALAGGRLASAEGGIGAAVSAGADIPAATVRLGIMPYGDHSILVIGIQKGFYKDVGIAITPEPLGESVQANDAVARLGGNSLDITTWYSASKVAVMAQTSNMVMVGFHDVYIGTYILAAPWMKAKKIQEFVEEGHAFPEAMKLTVQQLIGKQVALANDGAHRDFFSTVFAVGEVGLDQVELQAIADNQQVQLANSQRLDFASPSGAAQTVELMNQGWYSIVGTEQLLEGLPPGDPRAVATIGNTGPASTLEYINANYETVLRFVSVQFRIIDEIRNNPSEALAIQAPYLQAAAGTSTTADDLKTILNTLDPLYSFEEQAKFWADKESPYYYATVLTPQIEAAKSGGLIPADAAATPDDVTVGAGIYRDLLALKTAYDELLPTAKGDAAALEAAAKQYANRNYLDAYRLLKAATEA